MNRPRSSPLVQRTGSLVALASLALSFTTVAAAPRAQAFAADTGQPARTRVIAGAGLVALLGPGPVRVFQEDGSFVAQLGPSSASQATMPAGPRADDRRRDLVLDFYDVPETDRDSFEADDLVEDELTDSERRRMRGTAPSASGDQSRPAVGAHAAASRDALWVATADAGLWRFPRLGPPERLGPPVRDLRGLAASDDGALVLARGPDLLWSSDGGRSFRRLGTLPAPPAHLALSPGGRWLAAATAADPAVLVISLPPLDRAGGSAPVEAAVAARWPLPASLVALAACGESLALLTTAGLAVGAPGDSSRLQVRPLTAAGVACPRRGAGPWAVAGQKLEVSEDGTAPFRPRQDAPTTAITDLAIGEQAIWIATAGGLLALPLHEGERSPDLARTRTPTTRAPVTSLSAPRRSFTQPSPWATFLPRVSLQADVITSAGRRDQRALLFADLPLGTPATLPAPLPSRTPSLLLAQLPPLGAPPAVVEGRATLRPDPELTCLGSARRRAVALALAEPDRAESYVTRARWAGLLPEVRFRVDRHSARNESVDLESPSAPSDGPLGLRTTNDVRYEARATWDLSRLVFSSDELSAEYQSLRMADMRRELEAQLNRLYFERRRLLAETATEARSAPDPVGRAVRVEELEAELDALSGGAFGRCRHRAREVSSR